MSKLDINIMRGSSFTREMNMYQKNKNRDPYIISNEMVNPHWVLTISDKQYPSPKDYKKTLWMPAMTYPRFANTIVKDITKSQLISEIPPVGDQPYDWVYRVNINEGISKVVQYKYYYFNEGYIEYSCKVRIYFPVDLTKEFSNSTYFYNFILVDGELTSDESAPITTFSRVREIITDAKILVKSNLGFIKGN